MHWSRCWRRRRSGSSRRGTRGRARRRTAPTATRTPRPPAADLCLEGRADRAVVPPPRPTAVSARAATVSGLTTRASREPTKVSPSGSRVARPSVPTCSTTLGREPVDGDVLGDVREHVPHERRRADRLVVLELEVPRVVDDLLL